MFHAAARAVAASDNPYDVERLRSHEVDAPDATVHPFPYTPAITAVLRPFSLLSLESAQRIWLLLSIVGVAVLVMLSMKVANVTSPWWAVGITLLMPVQFTLVSGQLEAFLAPAILYAWMLSRNDKNFVAGVIIGAAIVLKHAFAPFLLLFVIERRWGVLAGIAAGAAGMVVLSLPFTGIEVWQQWFAFTRGFGSSGASTGLDVSVPFNLSLVGVLSSLGVDPGIAIRVIAPTVFLAVVVILFLRFRPFAVSPLRPFATSLSMFGAIALLAPFCMPYFWPHHELYATAALIGLCATALEQNKSRGFKVILALVVVVQSAPGMLPHRIIQKLGVALQPEMLRIPASMLIVACIGFLLWSAFDQQRTHRT